MFFTAPLFTFLVFSLLNAEPSADLDSVLLVRRGTTVSPWHAWLTLHKVRIAWG